MLYKFSLESLKLCIMRRDENDYDRSNCIYCKVHAWLEYKMRKLGKSGIQKSQQNVLLLFLRKKNVLTSSTTL